MGPSADPDASAAPLIPFGEDTTIGEAFVRAAEAYAARAFLAVPSGAHRPWHREGYEIDYATARREVTRLAETYRAAGFGHGHRVAMLLDNRPEHFLHKLALNTLGVSCVPINPDYRAGEIAYLIDHSEADLAIVAPERQDQLAAGIAASDHKPSVAVFEDLTGLSHPARAARGGAVSAASEASILYTSGTTGRPKGCMLSHGYELASGAWYAERGHLAAFRAGGERIYNPLPVYHVNSSIVSFYAAMLTGSCQIQPDRFNPERWWPEIAETRATIAHYLGIIIPLLMNRPAGEADRNHGVRFAIGAGVEPQLHAAFEERFGFPLLEVWGMTEMVRVLLDNVPPRAVGTRAFGHPVPGVEVRVVDEHDADVPRGQPGEMVIRHSEATPRKHFYSGYLKDEKATAEAWRGGWFHTGDTVRQDADGMLHFVDRKKNIIRRSGENIAAAEVEAVLQAHDWVKSVAVLAIPDDIREEEVLACIVLAEGVAVSRATAEALFAHCNAELAYFKAPGWLHFVETLPTTGTQKIQKHNIYPSGVDPRALPEVFDLRSAKKRNPGAAS
ncbi:MAG: AMP-binding protein [Phreatobacter sp.]|uniref:AMP-binding protein n=1 Tax=Phreatobacter sp. TaxID=1966341 RepID=UPI001A3E3F12|nr:AMP-binding protein [Phreatobacter sp.]MBL8570312.1 AMP-binding protein [Phreatobacter sp.]